MTQRSTPIAEKNALIIIGGTMIAVALFMLVGVGVWLVNRGELFSTLASAEAIIFLDTPGRAAIDGTLQVDGPAPVAVTAGDHTITFFDASVSTPETVSVASGVFTYVPNRTTARFYESNSTRGVVHVSAFPPNTTLEIPGCTPKNATKRVTCKSDHVLTASLSPGIYIVKYSNPQLGTHEETITVQAGSVVHSDFSFIATVAEWDAWRQQYGNILEQRYSGYVRRSSSVEVLLVPFEVMGYVLEEIFD